MTGGLKQFLSAFFDASNAALETPTDETRILRVGYVTLVVGLGGFLLWASVAPLEEGVPAAAIVSVDTQRKMIQHQAGGTVSKVLVKEAQDVKAGDVLIQLDDAYLKARYDSLRDELRGAKAQLEGKRAQLKLIETQLAGTRDLAKDGFLPRNKLFEEERLSAELSSMVNSLDASTAKLESNVSAAKTELERMQIRAPVSGKVVGLAMQTVGGVIPAGAKIMDVVPQDEQLVLETQVPPHVVDRVKTGMPVDIRFMGFSDLPNLYIEGKLVSVSADRLTDPVTRLPYFLGRVEVTASGLQKLGERRIQPGMSAFVIIKTGRRTMLKYLLTPLIRRASISFAER
ncbi:MAG: HlyD family efflux transporter periplasmic adaptor subunit [Proteobacteria bacterium]|nr:HlyD family efflux transporter periplasmic adaptor subunit [Pseudomonadota bacterium]